MIDKNTKILIVGLGLIGGSYAKALTNKGYYVGGVDINQDSIDFALKNGIIASGTTKIERNYISSFSIIIFALYPHTFIDWVKTNQHLFKNNATILDVTGVKKEVVKSIQSFLREDVEFIATHPMAGRETSGIEYSDNNIFKAANYIIVPTSKNTEQGIEIAKDIGELLEFKNISKLSVEEHDEMIGFLSQLTHCIAVSLMTCNDNENLFLYTGDSFRDLTRIAKINENMWTELFLLNKEELVRQMDAFMKEFKVLKEAISHEDVDLIKSKMRVSTARRKKFDKK